MIDPSLIRTREEWTVALQGLRDRAGLSYAQLSQRCEDMSTSTLQKMVTGESFPRAVTVRLFVRACGELDTQRWVDARNRVQAADTRVQRRRTPPGKQIRVGAVPRAADCFQEREIAASLEREVEEDGTVLLTQVLAGMGGVGKTQLAAAYARRAWGAGVGVLVWVNAITRAEIINVYADAALQLRLPLANPEEPEKSAQEFLMWTETVTDRWWLVVLDDVREPGDLAGLWPPAAESDVGGQVLVTTRRREAALIGSDRRALEVGIFTKREALTYLQAKLADRAADITQVDALACELGYLPLALAQAAAYIFNEDIGIDIYRNRLAARLLAEVVPQQDHLTDDHQRIITATWELSIEQADRAHPAGLARPTLLLASVLDSAGIPQIALANPAALSYLTSYQPGLPNDPKEAFDMVDAALRILHRYSLIDHDRAAIYREIRVHQLVQRATRENLATQPDFGPELYAALAGTAADALLEVWPHVERAPLSQVLRANAAALQQVAEGVLWSGDGLGYVLFRAAESLGESGQVTGAHDAFVALRNTALHRLGPGHPDTVTVRYGAAFWQGRGGDAVGAADAFAALLPDMVRVLGPDHPNALVTRAELASCQGHKGDAAGAVATFEKLLADMVRVHGPDHPNTLTTRHRLAFWRRQVGDLGSAVSAFEELLADQARGLGPDHQQSLATRHELASTWGVAGDAAGAVAAFEELLADRLEALGPDHPDTLATRYELAYWRRKLGDVAGAVAAFEELLADRLEALGPDHPDTLVTRSELARSLGEAGNAVSAVTAFEELLPDMVRVHGPDHPNTLVTRHDVATWRGLAGDAAGAVATFEVVLADRLRVLGPDHPNTLDARHELIYWQGDAGDTRGAVTAVEDLLADRLRVLGPDHPDTLATRHELAHWRGEAGDTASAVATFEELLPDMVRVHGPDFPRTLVTRHNLARWRGLTGDAASAAAELAPVLADRLRVLGPNHPETLNTRNELVYWRDRARRE
ncbi:tetratricopeptide repeat protein [Nonomuraea sp. NPDC050663]|uniref:tetratricopeptide repeat protein n=1 Tax=Nonomuraea sp. NPDC050663 TaxID=3364370 RepID=UPI00379EB2F8